MLPITKIQIRICLILVAMILARRRTVFAFDLKIVERIRPPTSSNALLRLSSPLLVRHASSSSVTGSVYDSSEGPKVTLFTKEGCTLCDKVKDVLQELREEVPHSLQQLDITDERHQDWFAKYKYDIPVLHVNEMYWLKHRTNREEARSGLLEARDGTFEARKGEPNAASMEHND